MTSSQTQPSYFDLHINGLGYLHRIRDVTPRKGDAFLACDIAALNGASNDVSYVKFDTRVSGTQAQHLVRRCINAVDAEKKVLIGFRLGDLWSDIYTRAKGPQAGQQAVSLKARLLFISWIKVDGQLVYKAEPKEDDADEQSPDVSEPQAVESVDQAVSLASCNSASAPAVAAHATTSAPAPATEACASDATVPF